MKKEIRICHGKSCGHSGKQILSAATKKIENEGLQKDIFAESCHCMGECQKGPNVQIVSSGKKEVRNHMTPRSIENEVDYLSGKKERPSQNPGEARNALDSLLSGGF
jgi:NADH:ubiquinone oxidoreductase subunit E